ncbi:50S ribosomal protein L4 [Candidatus Woesebacteria bacterium RIFCSPHIGHO2_02_FULL_38_9]|uniref:Large ribosomal subunit protein uL4 n=1 Tax=Candidatus Woesebacteria bacterium RIFCSPHIGHO2_01_FULL_39_28 TaxID=1802496 RepID=A0A1F7YA37_9BACT|nr:MAG: 50S ribosomal protein L4 [Candidatus Woesebacteria bacterium RIFCSPHIGHO2_01_FULL_39_28]OGM32249.1 MAG: 50S ribosomal protein L4 [Candidatus Woesebacteria bacterium RIFCSPHIGHO2_02_FULL_38_9]OGM58473.1 MAG: 50S ribosomal protein L4 [Candidatus Woesebacteria bacterium RIFCSPLOWO2_01_FULL_38_20]
MIKVDSYNKEGVKGEKIALPTNFGGEVNLNLIAQVTHILNSRTHKGTSKVKTRAQVDRTKKKVYRQKGTGSARHGARSAPIYVGGGVAHGPKGVKRQLSLASKMNKKALSQAIVLIAKQGKILAVDSFPSFKKTKEVFLFLKNIGLEGKRILLVINKKNDELASVSKNIDGVKVMLFKNLSVLDVLSGRTLLFDQEIFKPTDKKTK